MSIDPEEITRLVRSVVARTLGDKGREVRYQKDAGASRRKIITEEHVREMLSGTEQLIPPNAIVTPLALQIAQERRIRLIKDHTQASISSAAASEPAGQRISSPQLPQKSPDGRVAIGADHGGFELKELLVDHLNESGFSAIDCGTHSKESVDYPDYAFAVAQHVAGGQAFRGIIIDGAGIGSSMVANKVPGIRAAMCYDHATAVNSREHNDANVLTLGAGLIGPNLAKQIVTTWLKTPFGGGRHARRVDKIVSVERRFSK